MKIIDKTKIANKIILTLDGNVLDHCGNCRHVSIDGRIYEWIAVQGIPTDVGIETDGGMEDITFGELIFVM